MDFLLGFSQEKERTKPCFQVVSGLVSLLVAVLCPAAPRGGGKAPFLGRTGLLGSCALELGVLGPREKQPVVCGAGISGAQTGNLPVS